MKIDSVNAVLTGHRILNPEMQRSWALVRIETDDGTIGWGEASTNWGHSYPTVFRAVIEDV
jgi:L-alanine-DL-glutamate epimerase-like enolase superfamily enzyme